jgi:hypothetical protein
MTSHHSCLLTLWHKRAKNLHTQESVARRKHTRGSDDDKTAPYEPCRSNWQCIRHDMHPWIEYTHRSTWHFQSLGIWTQERAAGESRAVPSRLKRSKEAELNQSHNCVDLLRIISLQRESSVPRLSKEQTCLEPCHRMIAMARSNELQGEWTRWREWT